MKLFILNELSAFASDTVFKICLTLEEKGLAEENIEKYANYDELLDSMITALEDGEHVLVAADNNDYNLVKRAVTGKIGYGELSSSEIAEAIAKFAGDSLSDIDTAGHSLIMQGSVPLISEDGLYSGFSAQALSGRITCVPLDFTRIDSVLSAFSEKVLDREEQLQQQGVENEIIMPDFDLEPAVSDMVKALSDSEKSIALVTSEASMWVYNLYDRIDYLTDSVKFIEINDEESDQPGTAESESAVVIRHAKEAMLSVGTDFGGAVSDIYSTENAEGDTSYFVYVAFVDSESAKAKKINISDPDKLGVILPHALTLLCDMVVRRTETESREKTSAVPAKPETKKPDKKMIAIAAAVILVALIAPIIIVFGFLDKDEPTTNVPPTNDINVNNPDPTQDQNFPSTTDPFGGTTLGGIVNIAPEPSAADVSAAPTVAPQPSSKGIFTFYVFGYGHGVGMSQTGANYLANQGWTWAQILAHYYYDANTAIVTGDPYPQKITYAGQAYETREYLARALESEMGPSFHKEAIKAQCVAIYTFAKHYSYNLSKDAHAFSSSTPSQTVYSVVDEVMESGLYITHKGETALTPFHAMSAGTTTSYYNVWGNTSGTTVPYLAGGRKSYGDYLDDDFKSVYSISSDDFKSLVEGNSDLGVTLSGDPSTWLTIVTHDQAIKSDVGYVSTINVGGKVITGYDFRIKVMGGRIRSHCFALVYTPTA